jgi:ADP-ribosyltransferase exoenzyme
MSLTVKRLEELSKAERAACTEYYEDATLLHACTQGWSDAFNDSPRMQRIIGSAAELVRRLDSAIQKFELTADAAVYSGHGQGFSVVGSLRGDPDRLIGLHYCYPGYVSTSLDRGKAENFLRTRAGSVGTPVLLELQLDRGQHILPMDAATRQVGEAEYLLGRCLEFEVTDAEFVQIDGVEKGALHLVLRRAA